LGGDRIFTWLTAAMGLVVIAVLGAIAIELLVGSGPVWSRFGFGFLTSTQWDPVKGLYGALPYVAGTVTSSVLAMAIAVPVGIATAVFIAEFAPRRIAAPITIAVELVAAIPSVIIGLWGLLVLSQLLSQNVEAPIVNNFGWLPFVGSSATGSDLFTASLLLALMITPTIVALSREVVSSIPRMQHDGLLGLGGTRWEAVRMVVLPAARTGIFGACILALGRALGETIAVTMVIGNTGKVPTGLFDPAQTIASQIASNWSEASIGLETDSLVALGLVLAVLTVSTVVAARLIMHGRGPAVGAPA